MNITGKKSKKMYYQKGMKSLSIFILFILLGREGWSQVPHNYKPPQPNTDGFLIGNIKPSGSTEMQLYLRKTRIYENSAYPYDVVINLPTTEFFKIEIASLQQRQKEFEKVALDSCQLFALKSLSAISKNLLVDEFETKITQKLADQLKQLKEEIITLRQELEQIKKATVQ